MKVPTYTLKGGLPPFQWRVVVSHCTSVGTVSLILTCDFASAADADRRAKSASVGVRRRMVVVVDAEVQVQNRAQEVRRFDGVT